MAILISPDFKFINMNTGRNKNSNAYDRKCTIRDILNQENPTLVFNQENEWNGLHVRAFRDFGIPDYYKFSGHKDSGFIYDSRYIECQRLDLNTSVRSIHYSLQSDFELPRLCLCKIKCIGPLGFELLCACWHGPHNRFSDETKKGHLRSLLRFLMRVKVEHGNLPLILGGDFNLKSREVERVCQEISLELEMLPSPTPDSIMLWVVDSDFQRLFTLDNNATQQKAFDHDVLVMNLQISPPADVYKREREIRERTYRKREPLFCRLWEHNEGFESIVVMIITIILIIIICLCLPALEEDALTHNNRTDPLTDSLGYPHYSTPFPSFGPFIACVLPFYRGQGLF